MIRGGLASIASAAAAACRNSLGLSAESGPIRADGAPAQAMALARSLASSRISCRQASDATGTARPSLRTQALPIRRRPSCPPADRHAIATGVMDNSCPGP